jgi:uncharacterized protein YkwD
MTKRENIPVANLYAPINQRAAAIVSFVVVSASLATPALALDLNSFRAQNDRPPLSMSGTLADFAAEHARDMAAHNTAS